MIRENQQSKKTKNKHLKIQNLITSTKSRVLKNTKIYQLKTKMQEKKKSTKKLRERKRENLFCEEKLCKEWKKEWQIYSKMCE